MRRWALSEGLCLVGSLFPLYSSSGRSRAARSGGADGAGTRGPGPRAAARPRGLAGGGRSLCPRVPPRLPERGGQPQEPPRPPEPGGARLLPLPRRLPGEGRTRAEGVAVPSAKVRIGALGGRRRERAACDGRGLLGSSVPGPAGSEAGVRPPPALGQARRCQPGSPRSPGSGRAPSASDQSKAIMQDGGPISSAVS